MSSSAAAQDEQGREAWARQMRASFSPKAMLRDDGSIDVNYFRPKLVAHRWTGAERERLLEGLAALGVGRWDELIAEYLPLRNYGDVRLQVCLLLGRQDLSPYEGRRMTADDMAAERERNRAEAEPVGLWHHGVYAERQPDT